MAAENAVIVENVGYFDLRQIFLCGQVFRYFEEPDGSFTHVAKRRVINLSQSGRNIIIKNTTQKEYETLWKSYFDMDRDIPAMLSLLGNDDILKRCAAAGCGIRLLHQEPFETFISFLISQNNSIPNIRRVIERICCKFGDEIRYNGKIYHAFPTPEQLSQASLSTLHDMKCGYRADYIYQSVKRLLEENIDLTQYAALPSHELCAFLQTFPGVGPKVADCIALFGFAKYDVFPCDTWIIKAMKDFYHIQKKAIDAFTRKKFGSMRGYAQQYLFYSKREA